MNFKTNISRFSIFNSLSSIPLSSICLILASQLSYSQKKDENIGTEVVNVVKPYTPSISDAFKVKETPSFDDDETANKENIKYNIFSFPVASTFTPSKGKAAGVEKSAKDKLYSNYLTLAAGNFGTINTELFIMQNISNSEYFGGMLRHISSQGGINDVVLDNKFFDTSVDLTYGIKSRNLSWNADLGYKNQSYNWYGMNPMVYSPLILVDQVALIDNINELQSYQTINAGGRLALNESIFKEGSFNFTRFWDKFGSGENRFYAKPSLEFEINESKIKANILFDYINGKFEKDYNDVVGIKYGYANIGFQPSYQITTKEASLNLGATFMYSAASQGGESKFFIYPSVTASYKVVGDLMIAYAGAEGNLKQNSYHDFVEENFFVSPTLAIAPTDQKFDIYVGLKGKLANAIGYNVRGSYLNEAGKSLFLSNTFSHYNANKEGYAFGNSFDVVYDNVKTISFYGELKADFTKNVTFGISGTFSSYATDVQEEAWNLPAINIASNLDININPKWYAGTKVFFVGERKDTTLVQTLMTIYPPTYYNETTTIDSYFDLNAHIGYKHNDRLTFFLKGNNLAGQNYQRWINYPVQGIQVLVGGNYKFDF